MDRIEVPEILEDLSDEQLGELKSQIKEAAETLAPDAARDDEALKEIERLGAEYDRISAEQARREQAEAERVVRAEQALDRFSDPEVEVSDETEVASDSEVASTSEAETLPEIVEAAIKENPTPPANTTTTEEAPVSADTPAIREEVAVAALERSRPDGLAPADNGRTAGFHIMRATNAAAGLSEGDEFTVRSLAEAITQKAHGMQNVQAGTYDRIVVGTMYANYDNKLGSGPEENYSVLAGLQREANALVAAGGNCAPLAPSYDFFRLAEALNPVESCLPAVEAPRGGIRFITPPDFRDAAGGVRVTTEAEDAAGYPPTAPKPCVRVACPPIEECRVDAVSQCVTFGNLNYRVFPEQVEAFLEDLNVIFTETKEVFYLDAIDAASTAVTSASPYGASRGIVWDLAQAAAAYRRRNHMAANATLNVMLPSWIIELIKVDMVNDHSSGLGYICADTMETLECLLRDLNLTACFYYDSATGAGQAFNGAQAAGPLNRFPGTVVSYLFAPGTFVRLDAGTLDLGIVRDSTLNGTNDLQIFSEQWIQVCMVGLESIRLEHTLCPDGTAPEPVPPVVCP